MLFHELKIHDIFHKKTTGNENIVSIPVVDKREQQT